MGLPLALFALPMSVLGGAGLAMYTSGEPYASLYQPTPEGKPSLAMQYLNAYREGMRPMTQAAQGYGTGKFGGVKLAAMPQQAKGLMDVFGDLLGGLAGPVARGSRKITDAAELARMGFGPGVGEATQEVVKHQWPLWKRLLGVGAPLAAGAVALEALDPISDVLKPVATSAGERMSEGLGLAPDPWQQTLQQGIDALAVEGAQELARGIAGGVGAAGRAGLNALRRPTSFDAMISSDPVLMQAPPEQMPLLQQSYDAMQRVAPRLSQEPFVTKNFLRDIMVTNQGPDHATLSSLARSEQTIAEARG